MSVVNRYIVIRSSVPYFEYIQGRTYLIDDIAWVSTRLGSSLNLKLDPDRLRRTDRDCPCLTDYKFESFREGLSSSVLQDIP